MKRTTLYFAALCALMLCLSSVAHAKVRIVTTHSDLAAIADAVGGDQVTITSLGKAGQNPHDVDARPSFLVPLSRADLLILTGLELEAGWLPPLLDNARNPKIQRGKKGYIDASAFVRVRGVPPPGTDRASGDVHPAGNPHYLYDPREAKRVAKGLRDALIAHSPKHRELWTERTQKFTDALDRFAQQERARFAKLSEDQRALVAYHDSTIYLFDWLQITQVATLEPNPGISPTPRHTAEVLKHIREKQVAAIIQEAYFPQKTGKTLSDLAKIEHVIFPSATHYPKESYLDHMKALTTLLYRVMSP